MKRFVAGLVSTCALFFSADADAQNPDYVFTVGTGSGAPNTTVSIPVTLDNNGSDIQGWSFGLCNDAAAVMPTSIDPADSATVNGGGPVDFSSTLLFANGWNQGVVISLFGLFSLPAGTLGFVPAIADYLIFPAAPSGPTPLDFCLIGSPPVNLVVIVSGGSVVPIGISGEILVGGGLEFIRGDANNDASVNVADVVWLLAELFTPGSPMIDCPIADDLNSDGGVDISDPIYLLGFLFQNQSPPADPFPSCGSIPGTMASDCPETGCP